MATETPDIQAIFNEAIAQDSDTQRSQYLDQACRDNLQVRQRVEALLRAHSEARGFFGGQLTATDIQPLSEKPGTQIGPYKLLEEIGEGGMGVVYMAEQKQPIERRVALKIIKPGMDTRQVIARFEAEQQALAMMDHPNIAKMFDAGTTESGRPYFVMELVNGIPITQYCDQQHLTARERLELFILVCQAVQHAHQKGIIHRDIKPSNILIALYDGRPVPKVIDFGVAKATGGRLTEKTVFTDLGQIVGTLEYMSPEQAQRNQLDIDTRSDIYSLGVVLYELLAGDTPFDKQRMRSAAIDELLRIIREEEPPKPSTKVSSSQSLPEVADNRHTEPKKLSALMRGELDWIVMKALEKDRSRRYETASSFAADVAHYLNDEPVLACPPSARYRFGKFARRNKAALSVAGIILLFLMLLGSGIGWTVRDQAARQARVSGQVELILSDVDRLMQEQQWPEALVSAQRAEVALASAEAPGDVHAKVQRVIFDLELVARLEEIRLQTSQATEQGFDYAGANQRYAAALREYGVDVDVLPADESVRLLQSRSDVLPALLLALDDWAACRREAEDDTGAMSLAELVKALDTDPWRRHMRETLAAGNEQALDELVSSEEVARQPSGIIELLAGELQYRGRSKDALAVLGRGMREHPDEFWLHMTAAIIHGCFSRPPNYDEAIRHYTAALALRPRSAIVHTNLGYILKRQGRPDEAIDCYRTAIQLDPKFALAHSNLGTSLYDQGNLDAAIDEYRAAIELNPNYAPAHNNLGNALEKQRKLDQAIDEYRQAIEIDPKFASAHTNLGVALAKNGQLDDAIAEHRVAIELNPNYAVAHTNLGVALAAQGELDGAIGCWRQADACYRQANERDPKHAVVLYNLGLALAMQGKHDEAIAGYRQAIDTNPKLAAAYNNLAELLATTTQSELCNPAEAVQLARTAVQLQRNWEAWDTLSVAAYRAGDWQTSLDSRQEKLQRHPIASDDRLFLAMAHWQLGDQAEARRWYDEALAEIAKNEQTADDSTGSLRQEAEQLLGITTSSTPPDGGEPKREEPPR